MNTENKSGQFVGYCLVALTLLQPLQPAMAAAITAKNSNTQVNNVNNTTVINIAKPNNSGVSHNQFIDFNVSEKGAVLNNSTSAGKSQLAGQLSGNANLQGTNAKLIINEVVGNGKSELKGQTEVFGKQADILIANPNGITCDGCGFINTKNVTLTTGTPSFDSKGAIQALTTTKGTIVIGTKGMDTSNVDYTDIISRAVVLDGQIKAQNLSLIQGTNKIDYSTGQVTSVAGSGNKPTVAIDTKALGGMYANQIHLVSTENGVGVNLNNLVTTKNNIVIAADGKIQLGNITAKNNLDIKGKILEVNNNKKVTSGGNTTIAAEKVTNTKSELIAGRDMRIYADDIENNNATIQANNNLWIQKDVNDTRSNSLKNISGTIETKTGDLVIRADSVENITNANMDIKELTPTSNKIDLAGNYYGDDWFDYRIILNNLDIQNWFDYLIIPEPYIKDGDAYVSVARKIYTPKNINKSLISAGKNLYINSNKLNNDNGRIFSGSDMFLTGGYFTIKNYSSGQADVINRYNIDCSDVLQCYYTSELFNNDPSRAELLYNNDLIEFYSNFKNKINSFRIDQDNSLSISSGGNLIADFKGDIKLENVNSENYQIITNPTVRNPIIKAEKNIVLRGENIKTEGIIETKGDLTILANNSMYLENNELSSRKDINLVAVKDISLDQSQITANNLSILTREGALNAISVNETKYLDAFDNHIFGELNVKNNIELDIGKNIDLIDQKITIGNNFSVISGGFFSIQNTNSMLEKPNYFQERVKTISDEQYFNNNFNKTNKLSVDGSVTIKAKDNLNISGMAIVSQKDINLISQNDINLIPRIFDISGEKWYLKYDYFPAEKESELSSVINSAGNVFINAGRDIYSKAATISSGKNIDLVVGRDFLLPAVAYTIAKPNTTDNKHVVTVIDAKNNLTVAINGDLIANGTEFNAGGDLRLSSHGKMEFNSVVNNNQTQLGNTKSSSSTQQSVILSSGGDLSLVSDSSILLQATDLDADKSINAAAKGGFLFAQAMQETSFYQTKTTKRKWYGKKKTIVKTSSKVFNKVVDFTANDNITLVSSGDSTYQASQIKAGKDITLSSTNGKVIFEAVKDSEFNQKTVKSSGFYIKQSDKGYTKDTWQLPVIQAGGKFTVDAASGISADVKAQKSQTLENALTLLANTEGTQWLKDLNSKDNVEWKKVQDAYSSWNYETKSLNPVIAAVIAIAVSIATYGAAAGAGEFVAGATGYTGTTGAVISNGVAGGLTAISSKAAVSLVENQGNISKTLHDLGQSDSIKSIATSMIVAGAIGGFDEALGLSQNANSSSNPYLNDPSKKLTLISNGNWDKVAQSVIGHSIIDAGVNTAVNGGSFKDRFSTALLSNIGNQLNAEAANQIGHGGFITNPTGKVFSHMITSAITAEIGGGNGKGAAAGVLAAELAAYTMGDYFLSTSESLKDYRQAMLNLGKLTGAIAGGIVSRSPEGVYSGSNAGYIVVENNYLYADEDKIKTDLERQLPYLSAEEREKAQVVIDELKERSEKRNTALNEACKNLSSAQCGELREDLRLAGESYDGYLSKDDPYYHYLKNQYKTQYDGHEEISSLEFDLKIKDVEAYREWRAQKLTDDFGFDIETSRNLVLAERIFYSGMALASNVVGPKVVQEVTGTKPIVTAKLEINGKKFVDTNQMARPLDKANVNEPTLIGEYIKNKEITKGKLLPNGDMSSAHAEIGAIQQAYDAGLANGADIKISVYGKDVCGYCRGDIATAAKVSGAKSVTITAVDDKTGLPKTYIWEPGMKSIKEVKE